MGIHCRANLFKSGSNKKEKLKTTEKTSRVFLECKDHTVTGDRFQLVWNSTENMLITSPQPTSEKLASYYESEEYISHTDRSKTLMEKIYQAVKSYMGSKKVALLDEIYSEENGKRNLLDIGTGTGDFLVGAQKTGWNARGVEPNLKARKLAREKGAMVQEDIEDDSLKFNIITMWHVLEHLPDLEKQFQRFHNLLAKNGKLVIAVPNFESYDAHYYKEFWAGYDVPRHLWHFSKNGIQELFEEKGFKLEVTKPLKFDAFYVSMLSEKYKHKKVNYMKAFRVGWHSNRKARKTGNYSSLIYIFNKN